MGLLAGCSDPEASKQKHLEQGRKHLDAGNHDKANIELKNVLQMAPNTAEAYYLMGQVEEARKNWSKSLGYYKRAVELDPKLLDAHARLGNLFLMSARYLKAKGDASAENQQLDKVQKSIDIILEYDSSDTGAMLLKSSLLAYQGEVDAAVDVLLEVLRFTPDNEDAILLLAGINRSQSRHEDAEQVLKQGISLLPDNLALRLELATLYSSMGLNDKAALVMQEIIRLDPAKFGYRISLAAYYVNLGKFDLAERVYREAIDSQPDDNNRYMVFAEFLKRHKGQPAAMEFLYDIYAQKPKAYELGFKLANYHQESGEIDKAIATYERLIARWNVETPGIAARKRLAGIYLQQGELEKVKQLTTQVLTEQTLDYEALILDGKVDMQNGDYDNAVARFRSALKIQPDSLQVTNLLAESHLRKGDIDLAADMFSRATEISPDNSVARLQFARFLLAAKKSDQAMVQVEAILSRDRNSVAALIMKTEILMAAGDVVEVIPVVEEIKRVSPDSYEGWFRMGRIYLVQKQYQLARNEFRVAWAKEPESADLLAELTDLEIKLGETEMAKERLEALLAEKPDHPVAGKFLGMIYMVDKDFNAAADVFNRYLEVSPGDKLVYPQLASAYYNSGNLDQAAAAYRQGLAREPNDIQMMSGLAGVLEHQGDYDDAVGLYEEILQLDSDNAVAANNLVLIFLNRIDNPASLQKAEKIVHEIDFTRHPAMLDTLGWVYYKLGQYERAVPVQIKAVSQVPNAPEFHYHLGMTYMKLENSELASKHLKKAIQSDKLPNRKEAIRILESLDFEEAG